MRRIITAPPFVMPHAPGGSPGMPPPIPPLPTNMPSMPFPQGGFAPQQQPQAGFEAQSQAGVAPQPQVGLAPQFQGGFAPPGGAWPVAFPVAGSMAENLPAQWLGQTQYPAHPYPWWGTPYI